jgi:hypothetical protein
MIIISGSSAVQTASPDVGLRTSGVMGCEAGRGSGSREGERRVVSAECRTVLMAVLLASVLHLSHCATAADQVPVRHKSNCLLLSASAPVTLIRSQV